MFRCGLMREGLFFLLTMALLELEHAPQRT